MFFIQDIVRWLADRLFRLLFLWIDLVNLTFDELRILFDQNWWTCFTLLVLFGFAFGILAFRWLNELDKEEQE